MLGLCFGRTATLTVLYNLNLRASFAKATFTTLQGGTSMQVDTTIEPRQMFGGTVDCWPADDGEISPARRSKTVQQTCNSDIRMQRKGDTVRWT